MTAPAGTTTINWPDTAEIPTPPGDHPHAAARWLLGRHPQLAELAGRLPGIVDTTDDNGDPLAAPRLDLNALARAVGQHDARTVSYRQHFGAAGPRSDAAEYAWETDQPELSAAAQELTFEMSSTQRNELRLLATLSTDGTRISVRHLSRFPAAGQALIADWCRIIEHG